MSCCPGVYNLCIYQGSTVNLVFIWSTGNCCGCGTVGASSNPVDLTGYTATMQFRPFTGSPVLLYDASSDIILGGVAGTITLTISATDTETFTWGPAVYDLLLTDSSGNVTALLKGSVNVTAGVST
jgi:hypothetical protein